MLLWITFSIGIASVSWLPELPYNALLVVLYGLFSVLIFTSWRLSFPLLVFTIGLSYGLYNAHRLVESLLPVAYEGHTLEVVGEVVGLPNSYEQFGKRLQSFDLDVIEVQNHLPLQRLRLRWSQPLDVYHRIEPGQRLSLVVELKRPHALANPGTRDYQTQLVVEGISAVGRVEHLNEFIEMNAYSIDFLRHSLLASLDSVLNQAQYARIYKALLVADKRELTNGDWQRFNQSGTTHLMVISGLHIALVAGIGYYFGYLMSLMIQVGGYHFRLQYLPVLFAVSMAGIYALAAGLSVPTQRAWLMLSIAMLCQLIGRRLTLPYVLAITVCICLLMYPFSVLSPSFWLSFSCVLSIMFLVQGVRSEFGRVGGFIHLQMKLSVLLLIPLSMILGQVSLTSALCNLVLIPLFSLLIVPLNILAAFACFFYKPAAFLLWQWLDKLLDFSFWFVDVINFSGLSLYSTTHFSAVLTVMLAIGIAAVYLAKGLRARWFICLVLLPFLTLKEKPVVEGGLRLTVLDVGQGLSVLVETAGHKLLYDVGAAYLDHRGELRSMARSVVLPVLNYRSIDRLNVLTISHNDNDHAGDWQYLLNHLTIDSIHSGQTLAGASSLNCHDQQPWVWDGVGFEYFSVSDTSALSKSSNNSSCILKITSGGASILIPGDIERDVELNLISRYGSSLRSDILIAPHHGSKTSSSWPWVKTVEPAKVIFSAGYRNRFGHPNAEILHRYQLLGSETINTAQTGAYTLTFSNYGLELEADYRQSLGRFWH